MHYIKFWSPQAGARLLFKPALRAELLQKQAKKVLKNSIKRLHLFLNVLIYTHLNNNTQESSMRATALSKKVKVWRIVYKHNNEWHEDFTKQCTYTQALQAFRELNALGTFKLARIH